MRKTCLLPGTFGFLYVAVVDDGYKYQAVEHAGRLTIIKGDWKLIEPGGGPKIQVNTNTETGNDSEPQLYNLKTDLGERSNVTAQNPLIVK